MFVYMCVSRYFYRLFVKKKNTFQESQYITIQSPIFYNS